MRRIPKKETLQTVLAVLTFFEDFRPELLADPIYLRAKDDVKKVIADFDRARHEFRMREVRELRQKGEPNGVL